MSISIILACDQELGIGKDGAIPWHHSEDMKFFAKTTKDAVCVMGRKTYEDIYDKLKPSPTKPLLPNRTCIVLSSDKDFLDYVVSRNERTLGASSWAEASTLTAGMDVFITGGSALYDEAIKHADYLYITDIPGVHNCDVKISPEFVNMLSMKFTLDMRNVSESGLIFSKYRRTG